MRGMYMGMAIRIDMVMETGMGVDRYISIDV